MVDVETMDLAMDEEEEEKEEGDEKEIRDVGTV